MQPPTQIRNLNVAEKPSVLFPRESLTEQSLELIPERSDDETQVNGLEPGEENDNHYSSAYIYNISHFTREIKATFSSRVWSSPV